MGQTAAYAAGGTCLCCVCSWNCGIKPMICSGVRKAIKSVGPKALAGSECSAGSVKFTLAGKAMISICDLKVCNLDPFLSDALIVLKEVRVIFNLGQALKTKGKDIEINEIFVAGCKLTSETGLAGNNVRTLMKKLKEKDAEEEAKQKEADAKKTKEEKAKEKKSDRKIMLRKLDIEGVQVTMTTTAQAKHKTPSPWVKSPPIKVDDFSKRFGKGLKPTKFVTIMLELILNSVMNNMASLGGNVASCSVS